MNREALGLLQNGPPGLTKVGRRRKGKLMSCPSQSRQIYQPKRGEKGGLSRVRGQSGDLVRARGFSQGGLVCPLWPAPPLLSSGSTPNLKFQQDSSPGFAQLTFWLEDLRSVRAMAPKYPDGVDLWPPSLGGHKSVAKLRTLLCTEHCKHRAKGPHKCDKPKKSVCVGGD